jgi:hypothetical protein
MPPVQQVAVKFRPIVNDPEGGGNLGFGSPVGRNVNAYL